jgi:hypothetical protein
MAGITNGALARFAKTTEISLELPPGLPRAEWEQIGETLHAIERGVQWWLGDWWRYGEREYGESAAQAIDAGVNLGTVQNAAWVAGAVEPSRRREDLSFGHHQAVAPLEPAEQDRWLDKAAGSAMSVHELRAKIKKDQNGGDSTSDTVKLLVRAAEAFRRDNPEEGLTDFLGLAEGAWATAHGLT